MKPVGGRCSVVPRSFRAIPIGGIIYYSMSTFMATTGPALGPVTRPAGPVWGQRSSKSSDTSMPRPIWKAGGLPYLISSNLGIARKPLRPPAAAQWQRRFTASSTIYDMQFKHVEMPGVVTNEETIIDDIGPVAF